MNNEKPRNNYEAIDNLNVYINWLIHTTKTKKKIKEKNRD